jgi:hypothetical protein
VCVTVCLCVRIGSKWDTISVRIKICPPSPFFIGSKGFRWVVDGGILNKY